MNAPQKTHLRKQILEKIRFFNRRYFNPFALSFAGRPNSFWSVILHTGRRSGTAYQTPIVAVRKGDAFIVPLPYGREVDWFRNVLAAGSCQLIYQGQVYHAAKVEKISFEEGLDAFPQWVQNRLRRDEEQALLRLSVVYAHPDGPALYQSFVESHPSSVGIWTLTAGLALGFGFAWLCRRRK